jgi:polyisoprenoid-binding protein YceI
MRILNSSLLFVVLLVSGPASAGGKLLLKIGLTAGSFVAESAAVEGSAQAVAAGHEAKNVVVKLDTLSSGIELRDEHLKKKYLETDKHPTATVNWAKGRDGKFEGELTMRGQTQKIEGEYSVSGSTLKAEFKTKASGYGIGKISYMGLGVKDEVGVAVEIPVVADAPAPAAPEKK